MVLARCILVSLLVTGVAMSASMLADGKVGVDMKLMIHEWVMNNAMFTLLAEQVFERPTKIHLLGSSTWTVQVGSTPCWGTVGHDGRRDNAWRHAGHAEALLHSMSLNNDNDSA